MPIIAMLLAAQALPVAPPARVCRPAQLRLSAGGREGDFNGMSHSGTELSIRNLGPDCMLPTLPTIELRDTRGRLLPAVRRVRPGTHPDVMVPMRIAAGRRVATDLRWVSGPVFPRNRSLRAARVRVRIGEEMLHAPLTAVLYGEAGRRVTFDQTPLRAMEGMPAH